MATLVLVHGMWSGGWIFQPIARRLRAAGHEVYVPTLTGIGERVHLGGPEVDLSTHLTDVVHLLEYEELREVVLVGYSYGGVVVTGVADRVPDRVAALVYLDAWVPDDGQSVADLVPEEAARMAERARAEGEGWRIPRLPPHPRKTSHPLASIQQPLRLRGALPATTPRAYIHCTANSLYHAPVMARTAEAGRAAGWTVRELDADHDAPEARPDDVADLILELVPPASRPPHPNPLSR